MLAPVTPRWKSSLFSDLEKRKKHARDQLTENGSLLATIVTIERKPKAQRSEWHGESTDVCRQEYPWVRFAVPGAGLK